MLDGEELLKDLQQLSTTVEVVGEVQVGEEDPVAEQRLRPAEVVGLTREDRDRNHRRLPQGNIRLMQLNDIMKRLDIFGDL